jgi:hypothetical protein
MFVFLYENFTGEHVFCSIKFAGENIFTIFVM